MTRLQKNLVILISLLTLCMSFIACNLYLAMNVNPDRLQVRYQTITDAAIPEDFGVVSVLYFTDLQYGTYQTDKRMETLISTIEDLDPDVCIFGGDLYDDAYTATEESNAKLIAYLNRIDAPLGKFCVLGEKDDVETNAAATRTALSAAGFEILNNRSVRIGPSGHAGIRLVGFSVSPDVSILSGLSSDEYNLIVSHYPDTLTDDALSTAPVSLALAGHAHGTQLIYPILGAYKQVEGATTLNRAAMVTTSFTTILSAGVGCTDVDARLNADPEIHYFLFSHS